MGDLAGARGSAPHPEELLQRLERHLPALVERWRTGGFAPLAPQVRASCLTLGQQVRVETGTGDGDAHEGVARTVDEAGRLVLATAGGEVAIAAGEVSRLRPAIGE